jgi:hypothetical protein
METSFSGGGYVVSTSLLGDLEVLVVRFPEILRRKLPCYLVGNGVCFPTQPSKHSS